MKSITKVERAHIAVKIMTPHRNEPMTLPSWLSLLNSELNAKNSLRSTKELAHMFRYINKVMKYDIIRERELNSISGYKTCNTYYTLKEI